MSTAETVTPSLRKPFFFAGVLLASFCVLVLQIVQTRILSVMAWYYLAFFAISVAMLGMTAGAVWLYLRPAPSRALSQQLTRFTLAAAWSIPASMVVQFCLVTTLALSATTIAAWALLLAAMAVPYFFTGTVISLALTRSPFAVSQIYGADLVGAALGCVAVVALLGVLDAPSVVLLTGAIAALAALCFAASAGSATSLRAPLVSLVALVALTVLNAATPYGLKPLLVKDQLSDASRYRFERWNSYSRIAATPPSTVRPYLWGPSPHLPPDFVTQQAFLNIDGEAGTVMHHYDGTDKSIRFLRFDLVNLAYNLPGIRKSAVIGVGGGRDLLSAHLYGVRDLTGIELNPIFIGLHTTEPFYRAFSNLTALPDLKLHVDDARSWFASTHEKFDLIEMSMIDTWAATGAGAFSLSENGLYTLEGWRGFLKALNPDGVFTVSRWYNPQDLNETGRMIGLATAALLDMGITDARPHLYVARADHIATLVLRKRPFTPEELAILDKEVAWLGFDVLLSPKQAPASPLLAAMVATPSIAGIDALAAQAPLDLSVPTDRRPFFFNQLRFSQIPSAMRRVLSGEHFGGVLQGNLLASAALMMILLLSLVAVLLTIVLPLRRAAQGHAPALITAGSLYFALIGTGFMLAEIALLQWFGVYLGHPIYSLGVCLFSLILATGCGSLLSGIWPLESARRFVIWGVLLLVVLLGLEQGLPQVFARTQAEPLLLRAGVALSVLLPLGLLLGFAFPTGMRLVALINAEPAPWFWGINGATAVLASVLAVMVSMAFGIDVTLLLSAACYLLLLPTALALMRLTQGSNSSPAIA
jgi:hypothetical protein